MKKRISKAFALGLTLALVCTAFPAPALAAGQDDLTLEVTERTINHYRGFPKAVNQTIEEASALAQKDGKIRTVKVAPGTYEVYSGIELLSNVTLDMRGVTMKRERTDNLIHVGDNDEFDSGVTGYYYQNIKVIGGTYDCSYGSNTGIKAAHVRNFTMDGCTVKNTKDAHLMEIAGCDGFNMVNCTFMNQTTAKSKKFYEAVQLDVLAEKHFKTYRVEAIPMKNVNISGCSFINVPRGVGSHTGIFNAPFTNINITNNIFKDNQSAAIQGTNWQNVNISGNTITGSPRGITILSVNARGGKDNASGTFLPSYFAKRGGVKTSIPSGYRAPAKDMKISITGNTISLSNKNDPLADYEKMGILVNGAKVTKKQSYSDKSGNIPKGTYTLNGVTISGNKIVSGGHGIRATYVKNCKITGNNISRTPKAKFKSTVYGVHVTVGAKNVSISKNTIGKGFDKGIAVTKKGAAGNITSNTVGKCKQRGITLEKGKAGKIAGNKILGAGQYGISLTLGSKASLVKGNTLQKCKKKINISGNSKAKVKGNK